MIAVIFISILINLGLLFIVYYRNEEMNDLKDIAEDFEIKFNSMKIRYEILYKLNDIHVIERIIQNISKPVFIYGAGEAGMQLYQGIKGSVNIKGIIDQQNSNLNKFEDLKTYDIKSLENIRVEESFVIVTPVFAFDEIKKSLLGKFKEEDILCIDELL